jgi:hypothetical protein
MSRASKWVLAAVVLLAGVVALPGVASAQAIGGTVRDTSGAVLPGVTVEASSTALLEKSRTAVTDGSGQYLITGLVPGTYSVTFALDGFQKSLREGIALTSGFTANVSAQLSVGSLEETITVTGAAPVVDIQSVNQQAVMNRQFLDDIPSGRSFQNLGILVPGMVSSGGNTGAGSDVGGQGGQTQFKLGIHGSDPNDQSITVDGMGQESGQNGGADSMAWLSDANFSEIVLNYSANTAEVETGGVRVNMIPREGGNSFSGMLLTNFSDPSFQADNVDADLITRGLPANSANRVAKMWRVSPTLGGPIMRDKAWFYGAHTSNRTDSFAAGIFPDSKQGDLDYTPTRNDPKSQSVDDQIMRSNAGRITYQMTSKDKIGIYIDRTAQRRAHFFIGGQAGRIGEEGSIDRSIKTLLSQATWTRPATNRLLFEAGFGMYRHDSVSANVSTIPAGAIPALLVGSTGGTAFVNGFASWFPRNPSRQSDQQNIETYRGAVSYVTGAHAFKVGFQFQNRELNFQPVRSLDFKYSSYTVSPALQATVPNQAQFFANSQLIEKDVRPFAFYAQDKWTINRLTLNVGVRLDQFSARFPAGEIETSTYRAVPFKFDGASPYSFKDLQPRLGAAYDVFGNGKTALKFSMGRYADQLTNDILDNLTPSDFSPMTRQWRDTNSDGIIQGDPLNPLANGEFIRADGDPNFGTPRLTVTIDPKYGKGWGMRTANWETSASVEHELFPNVQVEFGYFHRSFQNFEALDNTNLAASDYEEFSVTVPRDPRLPNGGGYTITNLYDVRPASLGRAVQTLRTSSNNFSDTSLTWNGFDVSANARLRKLTLRGGISAGGASWNTCSLKAAIPEIGTLATRATGRGEFCDHSENWPLRGSVVGSYNLPLGFQVSGTMTSSPGPDRQATITLPASATTLTRPISQALNLNVIAPGTVFGERANTVDFRMTKFFNISRTKLRVMVDMFNATNNNAPTREDYVLTVTGADNYLRPGTILPGRLIKLGAQLDF